jgi:hypothetical protein
MAMSRCAGGTPITFLPPMRDLAFGGVFQPGNDVEQGRFAAARGADQNEELARRDVMSIFFSTSTALSPEGFAPEVECLADACDVERCCHDGGVL